MGDNLMEIEENQILVVMLPEEEYDYKLMIALALMTVKTTAGLKTLLYLTSKNRTVKTLKNHQEESCYWCHLDRDVFYEGITELYDVGQIKQNGENSLILM